MSRHIRPNPEPSGMRDLGETYSFSRNWFAFQSGERSLLRTSAWANFRLFIKIYMLRGTHHSISFPEASNISTSRKKCCGRVSVSISPDRCCQWVNAINNTHNTANATIHLGSFKVSTHPVPSSSWKCPIAKTYVLWPWRFWLPWRFKKTSEYDDPRQCAVSCSMKLVTIAQTQTVTRQNLLHEAHPSRWIFEI